ncbi:universal stress protein [Porticoccus sp.]
MASCLTYLVIMDPNLPQQIALSRAAALASRSGASLLAFNCYYLDEQALLHTHSRHAAKYEAGHQLDAWLQDQTKNFPHQLEINCESFWNEDSLLAACHSAEHHSACMIFMDRSSLENPKRWLQHAPCPLYLVAENVIPKAAKPVLAAIDPTREDDLHTALNHSVLATASNLAEDIGSELNLVCALDEQEAIAAHLGFEYLENLNAVQQDVAQRFAIDPARVHLQIGRPCKVIAGWAEHLTASVLVMGNNKERSLVSTLVGCTAEQLLDHYSGDLLVVN